MNYVALAQEKADWRENFDKYCTGIPPKVYNNIMAKFAGNRINGQNNGSIYNNLTTNTDEKGVIKETGLFSSFKAISELTPEQMKQLDNCAKEISKLQEVKLKFAKENEEREKKNDSNKPTLKTVFEENKVSITGLSEEKLKITDYEEIQKELTKALEKKRDEQEGIKNSAFKDNAPVELSDIKLENINEIEHGNLKTLMQDVEKEYNKNVELAQSLTKLKEKYKSEEADIRRTSGTNQNELINKLNAAADRYRKEVAPLESKKEASDKILIKARAKAEQYGQKAAKDDKTIGLDGKEIKAAQN